MDEAQIDEKGRGILFSGLAKVLQCSSVSGQSNVYHLEARIALERETQVTPRAGQFYMVKCARSSVYFGRPISVYRAKRPEAKTLIIEFLILEKGQGTKEICSLRSGDDLHLFGPLGNSFTNPDSDKIICIAGGGIGIAPVANFATTLPNSTYDFYASFKSGFYGIEDVKPRNLVITTDDGSAGIKGMLSAALTADVIKEKNYSAVYACGPTPMLSYVKEEAAKAGVPCFLSIEKKMLCGAGACLGCTIRTKIGNKRVCKDGPIFPAEILEFNNPRPTRRAPLPSDVEPDLSVEISGVKFKNPVIAASGTFGFGQDYRGFFDVSLLGGVCSKGLTLEPRAGNGGERIAEVPMGDINSIGLENMGVSRFISTELPRMLQLGCVSIANLAGHDIQSYTEGARLLDATEVAAIELNISCPNVKQGGMAFGISPEAASECVKAVRAATKKPLIVKLSPNAADIASVAIACIKSGADAISLINTIQSIVIDIEDCAPVFDNIKAGLCGPAVRPIALRMVWDVVKAVESLPPTERVPIIALGGIEKWQDAVQFIMAGASAVQVGSATFANPMAMVEIIDGLRDFMASHGYQKIEDFRGIAQK